MLFLRRRREQCRSFPGGGPGGDSCVSFVSVPPFSKKEQFPFPPGPQVHGTTLCDALLPHSRPRPIFASNQESTVQGRGTSPRTSGQSRLGPREFGEDASKRTAFCTIHPYSLSLHHYRYVDCAVGAACIASGGVALAGSHVQFDSATRFSLPGDLPSSTVLNKLNLCFYLLFYVFLLSLFTHLTSALFIYDKRTLLDIGHRCTNLLQDTLSTDPAWPVEILQKTEVNKGHLNNRRRRKKHHGKRARIRNRLRERAHNPPLPSILLANVQSLENKMDDLRARISFHRDIRDCNILFV